MLTYNECVELFSKARSCARMGGVKAVKLDRNTYLVKSGPEFQVILHSTAVVTFYPNGNIQLNTGGWLTPTTKDRINKFSRAGIYQRKNQWYLSTGRPFKDGMVISV